MECWRFKGATVLDTATAVEMGPLHIPASAWVRHMHMAADTLCMNLVSEAGTADGAMDGTVAMIGIMAYIATHMHSLADITSVAMG